MDNDDCVEILISEEEVQATWAKLLGEQSGPDPAAQAPSQAHSSDDGTAAPPLPAPTPRRRAPKVGTSIQRSGNQGERKLMELACLPPPPPPPLRARSRTIIRPAWGSAMPKPASAAPEAGPSGPTGRPAGASTRAAKVAKYPATTPPTKAGPSRDRMTARRETTTPPTADRPPRGHTAAQEETAAPQLPAKPRIRDDRPFRGRIVVRRAPETPAPTQRATTDPPPRTPARMPLAPTPRSTEPTRTVTVEPGVTLEVPLRAINHHRIYRAKRHGIRWNLRFGRSGELRAVWKK